jgi:serine-type D-Ala-D-Ala carboxypeptidase (penicillin-binding protein 5/6)
MTARQPARIAARRRRALLGVVLVLLLAATTFAPARHPSKGGPHPLTGEPHPLGATDRTDTRSVMWPQQGQAAVVLGNGRPAVSPHEHPAPIASLAKVMTAYLTLERYPLGVAQDGFTVTVTAAQAHAEAEQAAENQSGVAVSAGEQLTERQLLEALLIPSGNNIAWILATEVAGNEARFIAEMNDAAHGLGMDHTVYTDPSGFDPGTVSTASDQLRVFEQAMRFAVFRQIVAMPSVTLPVAGTLTNFNPLIADGYAGKTGSDSAAGGCLAFFTQVTVAGHAQTAVGVVMGQGQGSNTAVLLSAAGEAARQLVGSDAPGGAGSTTPRPPLPFAARPSPDVNGSHYRQETT